MSATRLRWIRWGIRLGTPIALALLWWSTAGLDAEWALWRQYSGAAAAFNILISTILVAVAYIVSGPNELTLRGARVALVLGSVVVTLGVLELPVLFMGHDYGQRFGTRQNDTWLQLATGVNDHDAALIHLHKPNSHYRGLVHGNLAHLGLPHPRRYQVDVKYDKNGFRNNEDFTKADIVAIGDSFVEGAEVPQPQTMVAELGRRLGASVANLGQSNYGPQQELVVLERFGVPLRPKVVLWFFFGGNDLSDVDQYERRRSQPEELRRPPSLASRSFTRNALWAFAGLTTLERRTASTIARRHAAEFTHRDGSKETLFVDADEGPWEPRQWEVATQTLAGAQAAAERIEASLLVVFVPRKLRVYRGFLQAAPDAYASTWVDNNLPEVLGSWCRARGIDFLDSTLPLRAAVASGDSVYLPDDVHWNAAGHRVVAAAVAERLEQMRSLRPRTQRSME